ncbi:UNVERIFIED_CONTAM: hypothetical protein FKN15_042136 [Acipenser sinensis]
MGLQRPLDICSNCGFLISSPVLQGPGPAEKDGVVLSEGRENSALMTDQSFHLHSLTAAIPHTAQENCRPVGVLGSHKQANFLFVKYPAKTGNFAAKTQTCAPLTAHHAAMPLPDSCYASVTLCLLIGYFKNQNGLWLGINIPSVNIKSSRRCACGSALPNQNPG